MWAELQKTAPLDDQEMYNESGILVNSYRCERRLMIDVRNKILYNNMQFC